MSERLDTLRDAIAQHGLDGLIVGDLVRPGDSGPDAGANVRWLTGFEGTSALCLVGAADLVFATDFRYAERAQRVVPPEFERAIAAKGLIEELAPRLAGVVGYDDASTSVRTLRKLEQGAGDGVELRAAPGMVEGLRRVKDADEQEAIAEAARLTDEVFGWLAERGLAGRTEREIARAAESRMRENGAEPSFPTIVAAGESSASPHHTPSDRPVGAGELVTIDMGSVLDGYCSDCTRTFAVGTVSEEMREVYELVLAAQLAGLGAVAAGAEGVDVDAAARRVIADAGHGENFGHGLGHGVGIEVHEAPRLSTRSKDTLLVGDVVTVEPGVYLPGRFGVRIEDLVVVEEGGMRNLSSVDKALTEVA